MAQFMFLIRGDEEAERSPEEMQSIVKEYMAWAGQMHANGQMIGGDELGAGGKVVRGYGGSFNISDGPYTETKEAVGGYFLINADNEDQAVALASHCPGLKRGGAVEVRAIIDHSA